MASNLTACSRSSLPATRRACAAGSWRDRRVGHGYSVRFRSGAPRAAPAMRPTKFPFVEFSCRANAKFTGER